MTVEVERDALLGAVRAVVDVVEARTTIPVLSNFLIEVGGGKLTLTGTDLDLQVSATIEAAGTLTTTIDARKFQAAVDSLRAGRVTIAPMEGRAAVTMKAGRGQRILPTISAADFPKRGAMESGSTFRLPAAQMMRMLDCTSVAMSSEETRYYLCGIYLHVANDRLCAAATDGHRLVRVQADQPEGADRLTDGAIVPRKAVGHLRKLLAKREGWIDIEHTGAAMAVSIGGIRVLMKLVDGTFPDYGRIIPDHVGRGFTGRSGAISETVGAVTAVTSPEGEKMKVRAVTLETVQAPGECQARAKDQVGTSAEEVLDVEPIGGPITFGVNRDYLKSLVTLFDESGALTIDIRDPASPIKISGEKDPDLLAVVMPMRI
ncbi:DNA polymerase III subunit beta [Sphingomonas sp. NY01]|uniref:DNA polymerase III subunit beta n=1 Tax=Sphingomonas sp. NY01 TaxID=2968057 RepID=UPI00315DDF35